MPFYNQQKSREEMEDPKLNIQITLSLSIIIDEKCSPIIFKVIQKVWNVFELLN